MSSDEPTIPAVRGVAFRASTRGGETGALIEAMDWSRTPLGDRRTWPRSLRSYVSMLLELPTPAIVFWGAEQTQIYNDGYSVIMGQRHPRFLGGCFRDCWPDTYELIYPWMRRVLDRGDVVEVTRTLIPVTRHGYEEEAYFTFSFSPLRDDDDLIAGVLQLVTEVTDDVLADRRSATMRALVAQNDSDDERRRVLAEDPADILFFAFERWNGSALERVFDGGDVPEVAALLQSVLATNHARVEGGAFAVPVRGAHESPSGVLVLGINPRLRFDEPYRRFFEAIAREIGVGLAAERESRARADAERERQHLSQFFAQAPVPLCILSVPDYEFLLANGPYERLIGHADVVGKVLGEVFTEAELAQFIGIMDRAIAGRESITVRELPYRWSDGQELVVDLVYHPLVDADGRIERILVMVHDVTAQSTAKRELETALRARDEFLSIASHELRTPLAAMKLQVDGTKRTLLRGDADAITDRVAKMIAQSDRAIDRINRLVEDMLDISRIRTGRLQIDREPVDVVNVVRDTVDRFTPQLDAASIAVTIEGHGEATVLVDRFRLEQVLTNLITNAIRYAPRAPVAVQVRREHETIAILFEDGGPGIADGDRERIFQRFERLVSSNEVSGLGLGLYIAREIIRAHGGSIRAESGALGGARFVIELPVC